MGAQSPAITRSKAIRYTRAAGTVEKLGAELFRSKLRNWFYDPGSTDDGRGGRAIKCLPKTDGSTGLG